MTNGKQILKLSKLELDGFRSFAPAATTMGKNIVEFGDVTILLGANGAGKSNIIQVFELLNQGLSGSLSTYFLKRDSQSFFFMGPRSTPTCRIAIEFSDEDGTTDRYAVHFFHGLGNRGRGQVLVSGEEVSYAKAGNANGRPYHNTLASSGGRELGLREKGRYSARRKNSPPGVENIIYSILSSVRAYQFHDTSAWAPLRLAASRDNSRRLMRDGGNLPAFLLSMSQSPDGERHFRLIERQIQRVLPEFGGFDLAEDESTGRVALNWHSQSNPEYVFGPHQLSDGSLRFIALATLLLQPAKTAPRVIVIDEPELGLHPVALSELAGMVKKAARHSQVILSTQSPQLIDEFSAQEIRVVEMDPDSGSSRVRALSEETLAEWLKEYSPSELWEKNLIGGRP